jgi:hypothetical protein
VRLVKGAFAFKQLESQGHEFELHDFDLSVAAISLPLLFVVTIRFKHTVGGFMVCANLLCCYPATRARPGGPCVAFNYYYWREAVFGHRLRKL